MHATPKAEPFRIDVPEAVLTDLKARLANTRWPTNEPKAKPWHYGAKMAFVQEAVALPELGSRDVLVYVMAAGVNYNNVWAAMGIPVDVIKARQKKREGSADRIEDFHIGGSDASGVVWATGRDVTNVRVGDEVVVHCGMWDPDDPFVLAVLWRGDAAGLSANLADRGLSICRGLQRHRLAGLGSEPDGRRALRAA